MSFLAKIFGPAIGETVKSTAEGLSTLAKGIRTAITGIDPEKAAELERLALEAEAQARVAQLEINKIEAGSKSLFVAGWRPFAGWVCDAALAFNFVVSPLIQWGAELAGKDVTPPVLDMGQLFPLVFALLGLGVYRSFEKARGVESRR